MEVKTLFNEINIGLKKLACEALSKFGIDDRGI